MGREHLPEREAEPPQARLVLRLVGTSAGVANQPRLVAPVEGGPGRRVAAAVRHDAADHGPLDAGPLEDPCEVSVDEGVVCVLVDEPRPWGRGRPVRPRDEPRDVVLELPVRGAAGDGAIGPPLPHELVGRRDRGELFSCVAVLREDYRCGGGLEERDEFLDVGECCGGHGREEVLHVDDQERSLRGHGANANAVSWVEVRRNNEIVDEDWKLTQ